MNRKVKNPFDPSQNRCFGCGPKNPIGLKLIFEETNNEVIAKWNPDSNYQGYNNVLHGGIIATLMDEVAAWYVQVKLGTAGVTTKLEVNYIHPVYLSNGIVTAIASLNETLDRGAIMNCSLYNEEMKLCAEAKASFFLYPQEVAMKKFKYPGIDAFHGTD